MSCPNCGASLKPDAKFCGSCGSKISSSNGGNASYPSIVSSSPSPLGLPPCQFKLIEAKGEGPDDDGDIRIELKYSVTNNTNQSWDYLAVTTQLVNFDGQVIEQSTDSFEQTLEPKDDTELDVYFGAANLKLLGQHPKKSVIVSTITACKAEFVSLGSIDIPADAFQVVSINPIKLGESAQLLSGSVYKTEPDSDKDCQVQVKVLIQNLTNLPLHEVKIIADVTDKSGRELCDAGGYEQLKPGELCLVQGNGYTKEKSLKAAKVELALRCYSPVAISSIQTNAINLSGSDVSQPTDEDSEVSSNKKNKKSLGKGQRKAKFEFHIKRAIVNMDDLDEDIIENVNTSIALIKKGQVEKAISALPPLNFEWIWSNGDGDPSEFFTDTDDLNIPLTPENSSIRVGETDGNLVLTIAIQFELTLVENCNTDEINNWLSDNSMFFCGYIGCGWTYHGDEGGGITLLS